MDCHNGNRLFTWQLLQTHQFLRELYSVAEAGSSADLCYGFALHTLLAHQLSTAKAHLRTARLDGIANGISKQLHTLLRRPETHRPDGHRRIPVM